MLEFNNHHQRVDLHELNEKAEKREYKGMTKIAGVLLSAVMLFTGCSARVDKDSEEDLNRAMLTIGDQYVALNITEYTRWNDGNVALKLEDGTPINVHPSDLQLYNNKSETMKMVEETASAIDIETAENCSSDAKTDRALIQFDDEIIIVDITGVSRPSSSNTELELADGTTLSVHPSDLLLFCSESPVMQEVMEKTMGTTENIKTR